MPKKKIISLRCPNCRTLVLKTAEDFPFCSDRCRMIDLGKWASGKYVISTAINDPDELESIAEEQARKSTGENPSAKQSHED